MCRVIEEVYFQPAPDGDARTVREAPPDMLIPAWILIAAAVYFGIDASFSAGVAGRAAALLLGPGP